jgi:hypothetical protein
MATKKKPKKKPPTLSANGKRIGRPRLADETVTLALRVPTEIVEALDRYVVDLAGQLPGVNVTRNDAMRRLLVFGLQGVGHLNLPHFPDGLNVGETYDRNSSVPPLWKAGQRFQAPPLLHPMPDPDTHPEWWDDATRGEE